jgi:hypothetical protein
MTPGPFVALLAAAALALAGCSSPEQKLVERRRDLRARLDRLYADYRGSGTAKADEAGSGGAEGLVGRMLAEVDRAHFEQYCLAIGRGERPFSVSGRLDAFVQESGNTRECRRAADLALEIESLEREVGGR